MRTSVSFAIESNPLCNWDFCFRVGLARKPWREVDSIDDWLIFVYQVVESGEFVNSISEEPVHYILLRLDVWPSTGYVRGNLVKILCKVIVDLSIHSASEIFTIFSCHGAFFVDIDCLSISTIQSLLVFDCQTDNVGASILIVVSYLDSTSWGVVSEVPIIWNNLFIISWDRTIESDCGWGLEKGEIGKRIKIFDSVSKVVIFEPIHWG